MSWFANSHPGRTARCGRSGRPGRQLGQRLAHGEAQPAGTPVMSADSLECWRSAQVSHAADLTCRGASVHAIDGRCRIGGRIGPSVPRVLTVEDRLAFQPGADRAIDGRAVVPPMSRGLARADYRLGVILRLKQAGNDAHLPSWIRMALVSRSMTVAKYDGLSSTAQTCQMR